MKKIFKAIYKLISPSYNKKLIISNEAQPTKKMAQDSNLFRKIIENDALESFKIMLSFNKSPYDFVFDGHTSAFEHALRCHSFKIIEFVLKNHKADLNHKDKYGNPIFLKGLQNFIIRTKNSSPQEKVDSYIKYVSILKQNNVDLSDPSVLLGVLRNYRHEAAFALIQETNIDYNRILEDGSTLGHNLNYWMENHRYNSFLQSNKKEGDMVKIANGETPLVRYVYRAIFKHIDPAALNKEGQSVAHVCCRCNSRHFLTWIKEDHPDFVFSNLDKLLINHYHNNQMDSISAIKSIPEELKELVLVKVESLQDGVFQAFPKVRIKGFHKHIESDFIPLSQLSNKKEIVTKGSFQQHLFMENV